MHPNRKRIEKREESSADRWARKAKEQARQNKIHEAIDDDVGIDFPSMPSFETFEEGNAWLLERIGEWYVRKCGHWELFQNSQRLPGFKQAEASWKRASGEFLRREGYGGVASGPVNLDEIFFYRVGRDPSGALVDCHQVVAEAAQRGDVNFFLRIPREIKRVAKRTRRSTLVLHMLDNWLHGFLWLMSDVWGSRYLQELIGQPLSQENYGKHRQRLKLDSWEIAHKHPLIEGYNPKTGAFTFRKGWTNLNPDLSR
jgi:hypothetical protein